MTFSGSTGASEQSGNACKVKQVYLLMLCRMHTQSWDIQGSYSPLQQAPSIASLATKREACTAKVCFAKEFEHAVKQPADRTRVKSLLQDLVFPLVEAFPIPALR